MKCKQVVEALIFGSCGKEIVKNDEISLSWIDERILLEVQRYALDELYLGKYVGLHVVI